MTVTSRAALKDGSCAPSSAALGVPAPACSCGGRGICLVCVLADLEREAAAA